MKDDLFFAKFFAGVHSGDVPFPKFEQSMEQPPAVGEGVVVKEIDITGEPRVTVVNDGLSPNDQITDPVFSPGDAGR